MSSSLDMSLDDIISKNKKSGAGGGGGRGGRGGGSRGSGGPGPARRLPNRSGNRPSPYAAGKAPDSAWQHDMYTDQAAPPPRASAIETGTKLYISNLDYGVSNEDIKELFSEVGDLKRFSIHYDRSGRSKGTAEIVFSRRGDALAAVKRYNNVQLDGKPMKIEIVGTNISTPAIAPLVQNGFGNPNGGFGNPNGFPRRKMKESIILKDRFYKMRKFNNCFVGSEAVDFLSEDQYLEREEAIEFGRTLANQHFFRHIKDENVFEDGNHFYRFLEHDPIVTTQCYNISWGTIDVKPKPIKDIALRLRFLALAIFEAYVSVDGRHVDYRSIHSSEEFQRYLRIVEELQRVDMDGLSREEKLAFFINLYNMMAIHAILTLVYPHGALDRKKFLGDFKYVIGGCTYSLSAIQNGILRGNQRPPYNLMKPFGPKDKRFQVALPFPEPLVHFALVFGTRSGPALRCYSPGNIDKELMESARDFLRNGGLVVDAQTKVASASRILLWYSADFGKTEVEVLKHAANYLELAKSEELLELLANTQLKVIYQPYDWSLNT